MTGKSLVPTQPAPSAATPPLSQSGANAIPKQDERPHNNSFDFLRLAAVMLVMVSHMYSIAGREEPGVAPAFTLSGIGLAILFSISGMMIARSWTLDPSVMRFLWRRVLRTMPLLIVVVLLSIAVLGPIDGTLPKEAYFKDPGTWAYLWNMLLQPRYGLPGVFGAPHPVHTVNGSFWTFGTGALLYLSVAIFGLIGIMRRKVLVVCIAIGFAAGSIAYKRLSDPILLAGTDLQHVLDLSAYFWGGAALYVWRWKMEFTQPRVILIYSLCALLVMTPYLVTFTVFAIPYLCFAFGSRQDKWFRIGRRLGDLSYGMYLLAYPVGQLVWEACHDTMPLDEMIITEIAATTFIAWITWHLVEHPFIRLRPSPNTQSSGRTS